MFILNVRDFVFQGKLQIEDYSQKGFTQPHSFEPHSFVTPTNCDLCLQMMWYIAKGGKFPQSHACKN